jgi:hypothetical protein
MKVHNLKFYTTLFHIPGSGLETVVTTPLYPPISTDHDPSLKKTHIT